MYALDKNQIFLFNMLYRGNNEIYLDIDEKLLEEAQKLTKAKTKKRANQSFPEGTGKKEKKRAFSQSLWKLNIGYRPGRC